MLRSRSLWRVLRRRGGVDRVALERRMREAMDADPLPYHPTRSNCVHFARRLLGRMPILDPLQIDSGPINSVSAAQLPLHHLTSPHLPSQLTNAANQCAPAKFALSLPARATFLKHKVHFTLADPKHPEGN